MADTQGQQGPILLQGKPIGQIHEYPDIKRSALCLMGVSIHNLSMQEAIAHILRDIQHYQMDHRPRYLCTANLDFFVNVYGLWPTSVRNPELLRTMRVADIVSADGMPIIWLSRLLGSPLKGRVAGASLIPALAQACATKGLTFFLLGGEETVAREAAERLEKTYPGLKVVGVACPRVSICGAGMAEAEESDEVILKQLEAAKPDILLIGLGNPKQEIWFHRIQHRLKVPMSIGVGGTAKFLAGKVSRAPEWMQHCGLEWLYRLWSEPRALIGRYLRDLFYLPFLTLPAIGANLLAKIHRAIPSSVKRRSEAQDIDFSTGVATIRIVRLASVVEPLLTESQSLVILDFTDVVYLDAAAIASILQLVQSNRPVFLYRVSRIIRILFIGYRVWDVFEPHISEDLVHLATHWQPFVPSNQLLYSVVETSRHRFVTILGPLCVDQNSSQLVEKLDFTKGQQHTIVDLSYCHEVDNAGAMVLLSLYKNAKRHGTEVTLCGLSRELSHRLKTDGVIPTMEVNQETS